MVLVTEDIAEYSARNVCGEGRLRAGATGTSIGQVVPVAVFELAKNAFQRI
ncbi:hypothetical protein ACFLX7_01960 [Chloroflexota bacterium]